MSYHKVHELRSSVAKEFQMKWNEASENARFYRMLQYSPEMLQKFSAGNRVPYVLDFVTQAINTYLGVQRDTRTDIMYLPVERGDEVKVELANFVKESILRANGFLFLESDIFQDGIIEKCGCVGYEWTVDKNPYGELKMFRVPSRQLMWDLNRRDYDLEGSQWVSRCRLYSKEELIRKYPDRKKDIEKMSLEQSELGFDTTYFKQTNDDRVAGLIEFYERKYDMNYFLFDKRSETFLDERYDNEKDAKKKIKEILQYPQAPDLIIKAISFPRIYKTEVANNIELTEETKTDLPFFPYDTYYPYWHDGEYWGVMDTFKDAQMFVNKMFSMIDHQINTGSKGLLILSDAITPQKAKSIKEMWNKAGGVIDGVLNPDINIKFIQPTGFDPRLVDAMNLAVTNIEKKAGGQNFLGRKETASESGVAVQQRVEQGSLSSFIIYDNLTRWKRKVGEKVLWYISNYMTTAQKIRIEGDELTQLAKQEFPEWFNQGKGAYGFLSINTNDSNTLTNLQADVVVDEAKHSVTKNQAVLGQISLLMQSSPMLAETLPPQMMVEMFDIPASTKRKWMGYIDQLLQAKLQKDNPMKPPTLSASLKDISILPAETQAQFAQLFGLQLNGEVKDIDIHKLEKDAMHRVLDYQEHTENMKMKEKKAQDQKELKYAGLQNQLTLEQIRKNNEEE